MDWDQVVSEIGPKLYRYFGASFAYQEASDLTQETLIRLVRRVEEGAFDPKQGSVVMFAYGIARLVRPEAWKSPSVEDASGDLRDFDVPSDPLNSSNPEFEIEIQLCRLREAVSGLSEIQRQIVLLHIDQELTLQDIGTLVGLPLNTVKSHIHRAKEILRRKLNPKGVENG